MNPVSADLARRLLNYDAKTGVLIWRVRTPDLFESSNGRSAEWKCRNWNSKHAGKSAGCLRDDGYLRIRIDGILYYGHRVAWLIVAGEWPSEEIDHRHGTSKGDRIENLRQATRSQNMQNARTRIDNTSGCVGVSWSVAASKWTARIGHNGRNIYLGLFDDQSSASAAYLAAKAKYHRFQQTPRECA